MWHQSPGKGRTFAVSACVAGALVALFAQGRAIVGQSLIGDGAYHLLAGEQALRLGTNVLNLEHPPLVKLIAALPLLAGPPTGPPIAVDQALPASLRMFDDPARLQQVRTLARLLLLAVFGVPWLWFWSRLGARLAGGVNGAVLLPLLTALAFPIVPLLSILQTDTAVACGVAASLLAATRLVERPSLARCLVLGLGVGLALATKHSGVLVLPAAAVALVLVRRDLRFRLTGGGIVLAAAALVLHLSFLPANWRYDADAGRDAISRYCRGEALVVGDEMRRWEGTLLAVERFDPPLAQWLTGLVGVGIQNRLGIYPTYAFGTLSSHGRWWFFPAVLLIQLPLPLLLATLVGAVVVWRRRGRDAPQPARSPALLLAWVTAAVTLAAAMSSHYNLGLRHLLPILPVLLVPAARWLSARPWRTALAVVLLSTETLALAPLWMSATNTWWLGERNPSRLALSLGAMEYHQGFLALADAARQRRLEPLAVAFPSLSSAELAAYLPSARLLQPGDSLSCPLWIAESVALGQYLPAIERASASTLRGQRALARLADDWRPLWRELQSAEDHGPVAGTFRLRYHPCGDATSAAASPDAIQ